MNQVQSTEAITLDETRKLAVILNSLGGMQSDELGITMLKKILEDSGRFWKEESDARGAQKWSEGICREE